MDIRELRVGMQFNSLQGILEIVGIEQVTESVIAEISGTLDYVAINELELSDLLSSAAAGAHL